MRTFLMIIFIFTCGIIFSQSVENNHIPGSVKIVFYNVENFFDVFNDSTTLDDEFTPGGIRHWDKRKFYEKRNRIFKVLLSAGGWTPPAIIGLAEIENRFVLNKLVFDTPLKKFDYGIIHEESPDPRGIDVALLYRKQYFKPLYHKAITVGFPFDTLSRTRDILYAKGLLLDTDTLHIFVNHWTSKYGGLMNTIPKRIFEGELLRKTVDSIFEVNNTAKIIIMGDFNDSPFDRSLVSGLNAKTGTSAVVTDDIYNLAALAAHSSKTGTHKYQGHWEILDQFIVSGSLLQRGNGLRISQEEEIIYNPDFLLEEDNRYTGMKPFRTFNGMRYKGGFSDHLPVILNLITKNEADTLKQQKSK